MDWESHISLLSGPIKQVMDGTHKLTALLRYLCVVGRSLFFV